MSGSATAQQRIPHYGTNNRKALPPAAIIGSAEQVQAGSVLIEPETSLPRGVSPFLRRVGHWNLIADLPATKLDHSLRTEGWHFFFVVPQVEHSGAGLSFHTAFRKALAGVVRQVGSQGLNAVEIASIKVRRFLGLHYVMITAYPRHIRDSPYLRDPDPHHYVRRVWDFKRIFGAQNRARPQVKAM